MPRATMLMLLVCLAACAPTRRAAPGQPAPGEPPVVTYYYLDF